jgi:hypothetical protein
MYPLWVGVQYELNLAVNLHIKVINPSFTTLSFVKYMTSASINMYDHGRVTV